jgi:hypothetical protein
VTGKASKKQCSLNGVTASTTNYVFSNMIAAMLLASLKPMQELLRITDFDECVQMFGGEDMTPDL